MDLAHPAQAVGNMATLPPEANVRFMTLMATRTFDIGRGWMSAGQRDRAIAWHAAARRRAPRV